MSDRNEPIECDSHGEAITTFVCSHLGPNIAGIGFNMSPEDPDDPWPDAICDACASREGPLTQDDIKILCHHCYEYTRARNVQIRRPDSFQEYLAEAVDELKTKQDRTFAEFKIGEYPKWNWDQTTGQIVFSRDGKPQVIARIQFVGSISTKSGTWRWSWANSGLNEDVTREIERVCELGEERGWDALVEVMWPAEEADGWEMTAIAARVLNAQAAYRTPGETGFTFMLLMDVAWAA